MEGKVAQYDSSLGRGKIVCELGNSRFVFPFYRSDLDATYKQPMIDDLISFEVRVYGHNDEVILFSSFISPIRLLSRADPVPLANNT